MLQSDKSKTLQQEKSKEIQEETQNKSINSKPTVLLFKNREEEQNKLVLYTDDLIDQAVTTEKSITPTR